MNILHISNVLPSPAKDRVNDILLITSKKFLEHLPNANNRFVVTIPYTNFLISLISKKWKRYYDLRKKGRYIWDDVEIEVLALPLVNTRYHWLRFFLYKIGFFLNRKKLVKIIKECNPDIIHGHNVAECAFISAFISKRKHIPYVVTSRNIQNFYNDYRTLRCLQRSNGVININYRQLELVKRNVPSVNSYLVPHGIDNRFFLTGIDYIPKHTTELKLVSLCSLLELKNLDKVLIALNNLDSDVRYDIYGDGPDLGRLNALLQDMKIKDRVSFKGFINHDNVAKMLSEYDVFVMPSYPETFGRVFLESMAVGLPVIGARGTGIDGYIEHGVSGFLVDHRNIDELEEVLRTLNNNFNLRSNISSKSKELAKEFQWDVIIRKLIAIYQSAISDFLTKSL